jgi:HAD superfamily hydrolase (TIGR01490 family)
LRISVFDLDHTLITQNSSLRFSYFLLCQKVLSPWAFLISAFYYYRHRLLGLSQSELHIQIFKRLLKGLSPELLQRYVEKFVEEWVGSILYMPALSQLRFAQQMGDYTAIFSNSPDFLVGAIAKYLHVDEWKATSYILDDKHRFSAISYVVDGEKKRELLQQMQEHLKTESSQITAYSDSHLDLPFLLAAGHQVAVNPNLKLKQYALSHNWPII